MYIIKLTNKQYETLVSELSSLFNYHWNDKRIHANECGSDVIDEIIYNHTYVEDDVSAEPD